MVVPGRSVAAVLAACVLMSSAPAFAATPQRPSKKPGEVPARTITIVVNGEDLPRDPAPRDVRGRLFVPVVRIYNALGIAVTRDGDDVTAAAPAKRIVLHIGSAHASVDNRDVVMDGPAAEIGGATFVPLRFVAQSLGADVRYDPAAQRVEVVSSLVGRNPGLEQRTATGSQLNGSVSAIDLNSSPESITVVGRSGEARTVSITSDAKIVLQDTVARTSAEATLVQVHPGDAVTIVLRPDGRIAEVAVRYATRTGEVAAVSPSAFVLKSGYVVTPDRSTEILLNGSAAKVGDLKVGDAVSVRINPDTLEKRQILVTRAAAADASPTASPNATAGATAQITSVAISANRALRGGDAFDVTLLGTPGGRATFDIGTFVTGQAMREDRPGVYLGHYQIPPGANFGQAAVFGYLHLGDGPTARAEAKQTLAVSSTPPQIVDVAPPAGQTVNNDKPSIFATFTSPTGVGIDPKSATIEVNGHDVTAASTRAPGFLTYVPGVSLPDGPVTVVVTVSDLARNVTTKRWTFTIRTK